MLATLLQLFGLKQVPFFAGLVGGAISGAILPGPLAAISSLIVRIGCGSLCGGFISGYCAEPLAAALSKPDYLPGIAIGVGFAGLSFFFKVLSAWNALDLSAILARVIDNFTRSSK